MDANIVDILVGMYFFKQRHIIFTTMFSLAARRNHVVLVQFLHQFRSLSQPCRKRSTLWSLIHAVVLRESTRLVAYLPTHDAWVVHILHACVAVRALHDVLHVLEEQFLSLLVR